MRQQKILTTAWNMIDPHRWSEYAQARRSDRVLLLSTMVLTVLVDLTVAIGVGVALGLAWKLSRRTSNGRDWSPPKR